LFAISTTCTLLILPEAESSAKRWRWIMSEIIRKPSLRFSFLIISRYCKGSYAFDSSILTDKLYSLVVNRLPRRSISRKSWSFTNGRVICRSCSRMSGRGLTESLP
jgi:hypothetical protein